MARVNITNGTDLYYGPGAHFAVAGSTGAVQNVAVRWTEGQYYYVELSSPPRCLYVKTNDAHVIPGTGTIDTFVPASLNRYVKVVSTPRLGESSSYKSLDAGLENGLEVRYLGRKAGSYVFIEFKPFDEDDTYRAWYPEASLKDPPSEMTPQQYELNMDALEVETNPRYQPVGAQTYCSLFAQDVMRNCGTLLPDYGCAYIFGRLSAGFSRWIKTDFRTAQLNANDGCPTVALDSGHIAVVRPNDDGTAPAERREVVIAQAGRDCYEKTTLNYGWDADSPAFDEIQFYSWNY